MLLGQLFAENLGGGVAAGHRSLLELSHEQVRKWWWGREIAFGSTWDPREGIAFWSTWDVLGFVRSNSNCQRFLPSKTFFFIISAASARSQSVLDHKRTDPSPH
jgi:hypothetical protein